MPGDELPPNIATDSKLDSKTPSHVSSPRLISASPTYNPAHYGSIRLGDKSRRLTKGLAPVTAWSVVEIRVLRKSRAVHTERLVGGFLLKLAA